MRLLPRAPITVAAAWRLVLVLVLLHCSRAQTDDPELVEITRHPEDTSAVTGSNATFHCEAAGSILWIVGGVTLDSPDSLAHRGILVVTGLGSSRLHVLASEENHGVEVQCQVTVGSSGPTVSRPAVLTVTACLPGVTGTSCDHCLSGYYDITDKGCKPCECHPDGSLSSECDIRSGQCPCAPGVGGRTCDECPERTIGPSLDTASGCTECFCNGYLSQAGKCESAEGWYQAEVSHFFVEEEEKLGFRSNGVIIPGTVGYLEATITDSDKEFVVSFPQAYLGDKRTSYAQSILLNLSIPEGSPDVSLTAKLEITSQLGQDRPIRLIITLPGAVRREPQLFEIPLLPGSALIDRPYRPARATAEDVREVLTNVLRMVLRLALPRGSTATGKTLHIYHSSIPYATPSLQDSNLQQPARNVTYVEQCSFCVKSRIGTLCDECSSGYTTDPHFGGEFAKCVRCFCLFHSEMCDPVSGVCTDCQGNTAGEMCEGCVEGYQRSSPYLTEPCDECADGYWEDGDGVCIPCNCHPNGSLSFVCNKETGVCTCREGVTGDRCDRCQGNTTQNFPECEPCNECTTAWQEVIDSLRVDVEATLELVRQLNLTNITLDGDELPALTALFELIQNIEEVLNNSQIDVLSQEVQSTHAYICNLTSQLQSLIDRASLIEQQLRIIENTSDIILSELERLRLLLMQLHSEYLNVTENFPDYEIFDSAPYVELTQEALERSDSANATIRENVTLIFTDIQSYLFNFTVKLNESRFNETLEENTDRLARLQGNLTVFAELVAEANRKLCGASINDSCDGDCGGVNCSTCGAGANCRSLVRDADEAANTSAVALRLAQEALAHVQEQVERLEALVVRTERLRANASEAEEFANDTLVGAERLLLAVRALIVTVEQELSVARINPQLINERENETLALMLPGTPEEFLDILIAINDTIAEFFINVNTSEDELRKRVCKALERAEVANELAMLVVANASALRDRLSELLARLEAGEEVANETELLVNDTRGKLTTTDGLLDDADIALRSTQRILTNLTVRLPVLQELIATNRRDLENATNTTDRAEVVTAQANQDSLELEANFTYLKNESERRLRQSELALLTAQNLTVRTRSLQTTAQDQLLQVEYLARVKEELTREQEEIRVDIRRVANELERRYEQIQVHIARNTECLDAGSLSRRRRRRQLHQFS